MLGQPTRLTDPTGFGSCDGSCGWVVNVDADGGGYGIPGEGHNNWREGWNRFKKWWHNKRSSPKNWKWRRANPKNWGKKLNPKRWRKGPKPYSTVATLGQTDMAEGTAQGSFGEQVADLLAQSVDLAAPQPQYAAVGFLPEAPNAESSAIEQTLFALDVASLGTPVGGVFRGSRAVVQGVKAAGRTIRNATERVLAKNPRLRNALGRLPTKANRGGHLQPYEPRGGEFAAYRENSLSKTLSRSPAARVVNALVQGYAEGKAPGASLFRPIGTIEQTTFNLGQILGSF